MALHPCRDCGSKVSSQAVVCPHCGAARPADHNWKGTGIEWKSRATVLGIPLVHVAFGRDRQGKLRVAKGIIAIGQFAVGLFTVAQFGIGIIFGLGQFVLGIAVLGQFAVGLLLGVGQFATGVLAVGQFVFGIYGLCQTGWAKYLWTPTHVDMEAVAMFSTIKMRVCEFLGLGS